MRRSSPRPVAAALERLTSAAAPATVLARVQGCWPGVVGETVAAEAEPVREEGGTLTISCRSAVWAQELELMGPDLLERLNRALDPGATGPLTALRARAGGPQRADDRATPRRFP